MKRMLFVAAATLISVCTYSSASASIWTDGLTFDGEVDVVQDNSVSLALADNGPGGVGGADGIVNTGDVVGGIIKWNVNISTGQPFGDHAIVVFAARVVSDNGAGSTVLGGDPTINFSLDSAPGVLNALLPTISASVGGFTPGTLGVMLSGVGTDPTTLALGTSLATIDSTYAPDFEFGILTGSDYFEAELRDHRIAGGGLGQDGIISLNDSDGDSYINEYDDAPGSAGPGFAILPGSGVVGQESGGFSVLRDFTGPGPLAYLPIPTTRLNGTTTGASQILLTPSTTLIQPTRRQAQNGYSFADQSIVALNPVPEPGSLAIFGLMGAAGIVARRRRKK